MEHHHIHLGGDAPDRSILVGRAVTEPATRLGDRFDVETGKGYGPPTLRLTGQLGRLAILFAVGTALAPEISYAYRTGEDSEALAGRGRVAWSSPRVGFAMSEGDLPAGVTKDAMEQALAAAFDAWKGSDCTAVEPYFTGWTAEQPATKDGVNTIAWIGDWAKRGYPTQSPGYTDMQYRGHDGVWEIADADLYLDATSYDWTIEPDQDTSLQAVLTHELGHALGLLHPCELEGAEGAPDCAEASTEQLATSMYPLYSPAQASPEGDDLSGICYLYPAEGACVPACSPEAVCIEGECRVLCGIDFCEAGQVCGYWGCAPEGSCLERACDGQPCEGEGTCGPLAVCKKGACASGQVPWGSGCSATTDCHDGACVDHVCQPACRNGSECGEGKCEPDLDERVQGCVASRAYPAGARCAVGEDCGTGLCLFTASPAVCTSECRDNATCPKEWSCRGVDGRDVCVPKNYQASGGGCALGSGLPGGAQRGWWLLAGLALIVGLRWRSRRQRPLR